MSETGKPASAVRGVPDVVIAFFEKLRPALEAFATKRRMALYPFEYAKTGDAKWVWNIYSRCWGRKVCIQVLLDSELAVAGKALVTVFISPATATSGNVPWKECWNERLESAEQLLPLLDRTRGDLAKICRGMLWLNPKVTPVA